MKISKQAITFMAFGWILSLSPSLYAQTQPGKGNAVAKPRLTPEQRAQQMTDRQKENLGLSEEQYKKVLEINTNKALQHEALRMDAQKAREQRQAAAKEIESSRDAEYRKVLNAEQFAKYQQQKQEQMEKAKARREAGPPRRGAAPRKGH